MTPPRTCTCGAVLKPHELAYLTARPIGTDSREGLAICDACWARGLAHWFTPGAEGEDGRDA